ncbi:MAG: trypsin-like peptidase domain-containing protein [Deltaproteobacteria bacterium]|nr:trypsin-like peptidase domain-containing protein [Deltaproteobacteria bacterium]
MSRAVPVRPLGYAITFPIFLVTQGEGGKFVRSGDVVGTAFAVHDAFMITAGHVAKEIGAAGARFGVVGLADPFTGDFKGARIVDSEVLPCDVAIIQVEFDLPDSASWFQRPKWRQAALKPFDLVRALGFPYAMRRIFGRSVPVQRGFQGHVVSHLQDFKPMGWDDPGFPIYEVSFAAPRGLSGAPLLNSDGEVSGIVIGNTETKMLVFESEETMTEPTGMTRVERYEALRLGIAVDAKFVLGAQSRLLQASIDVALRTRDLLV